MVVYLHSVSPHWRVRLDVHYTPAVLAAAPWTLDSQVHHSLAESYFELFFALLALHFQVDFDGRTVDLYNLVGCYFLDYLDRSSFKNGEGGKQVLRGTVQL